MWTLRCSPVQRVDVRRAPATDVGAVWAELVLRSGGDDDHDDLGHATVTNGNESLTIAVTAERPGDIRSLLTAAVDAVAAEGGGEVHWWVQGADDVDRDVAAAAGLSPGRRLLQLRRPLPTGLAVEVETRAFRPGHDEAAWVDVNNRAFAGHREQGGWTVDTLRRRESESWFDADGFRLHERDGRLAAFCWTKLHEADRADPPLGEIYVIGVDPDFQGLGLGRQLTLAGLDSISARGVATGMLYVDAANTKAVGMYEGLGFTHHRVDVAFTGWVGGRTLP